MAARTTEAEVGKIIDLDPDITDLDPFILAANELVTELCEDYYEAVRLTMIETWLAAHFYAIRDPRATSEGVGPMNTAFQGQTTMALSATTFGQQAMALDTLGKLSVLNRNVNQGRAAGVAGITWLGTEEDEE